MSCFKSHDTNRSHLGCFHFVHQGAGCLFFLFLTPFHLSQALLLHHVMPSPMSMKQASSWSGLFPWRQVAGRMCVTTSCADGSCQTEGAWKNAAPAYVFYHDVSACQTLRWWWPTCSHTPTTASCWRLSTGCLSWPKITRSSMWHLMWQPIRQVCWARSVTTINAWFLPITAPSLAFQSVPQLYHFFSSSILTYSEFPYRNHYHFVMTLFSFLLIETAADTTCASDSGREYLGLITKTPDDQIITVFVQQICCYINLHACTIPAVNERTIAQRKAFFVFTFASRYVIEKAAWSQLGSTSNQQDLQESVA